MSKADILIVDDEANTLASLARAFRLAGHEATVCDNAAKALELAKSRPFDLILSDVVMPGRDGLALLEVLKSSGVAAPVVMMSGQAHIEMDVGQRGESVANVVVDGALADFTTLDVSDGNAQGESDGCRREHLIAVGDQQQHIGTPGGEGVSQAEDGDADGLGHAGIGVGAEQALDARLDGKAVALDLVDGRAKIRREMRA